MTFERNSVKNAHTPLYSSCRKKLDNLPSHFRVIFSIGELRGIANLQIIQIYDPIEFKDTPCILTLFTLNLWDFSIVEHICANEESLKTCKQSDLYGKRIVRFVG